MLENRNIKVGLLLLTTLMCGFVGVYLYASNSGKTNNLTDAGLSYLLINPAFAQGTETTFLEEEAGLSIYLNIGRSIDLAVAKTVYRTIEKETSNYTVGSVALPGLSEDEDVHCFVHKDGWIVAYYLKGEPISKIVDWNLWSEGKLTKNKLQVGLEQMTNALGTLATNVKYYHFQYPNANKCMIILETLVGSGEDSFNITIPNDITVYERSWSHYSQDIPYKWDGRKYDHRTDFKIDTVVINSISNVNGPVTQRGTLSVVQLFLGQSHIVSVYSDYAGSNLYGVCIGLVYQEP